ncbi:hypothetical protein FHU34_111893 [Micromonospora taraxaci]|uniref:Uncharacterized protein n=1 Tax=Micromonospora taraxaci TaxID=1316803 RepID=A0A561VY72_9ACTN|nr:hypothetical protein FHU34_111893 [Micromonospora taraxaci]
MGITVHRDPAGRHRIAQVADPLHSRYALRSSGRNSKRSAGRDTFPHRRPSAERLGHELGHFVNGDPRRETRAGHGPDRWRSALAEARMEQIDAELAREYERFRRTVSWSA